MSLGAMSLALWWCFVLALCVLGSDFDKDPYKVLGVGRKASQAQIKKAYRSKARETHPDKNPDQDNAESMFRDVASSYEILSDDNARKKYDRFGHQKQQQQQQQHGGFHQRAREQHFRFHQEQQRRRQESLTSAKYKRAQDRVMWVNSLSHLRNVAIDEDTGKVDKHFILAMYHHGGGCETALRDKIVFPYPFAHNSDNMGIWWEDVVQTAKALSTEQGRPEGAPSDIAAKFGVDTKSDGSQCPAMLYWRKGSRLSKPEKSPVFRSNTEFQEWLWERLKVVAVFRNEHTHDVKVYWMKGLTAQSEWVLKPGQSERRLVYLSHLFVARDTRVTSRQVSQDTSLLWHHVRGGSQLNDNDEESDYEIVIKSKDVDLHKSCRDWARKDECRKNPNYMVVNCAASCAKAEVNRAGGRSEL